jgi:hypothetical protein
MSTLRLAPLAFAALACTLPAQAADAPGAATERLVPVQAYPGTATVPARDADTALVPPAAGHPTTVIYVYPTSPATFVPVTGLPSFIIQPGAPVPMVATHVVHAVTLPDFAARTLPLGDLDCANFEGPVRVIPPDVNHLDPDGDGLGCEPGER